MPRRTFLPIRCGSSLSFASSSEKPVMLRNSGTDQALGCVQFQLPMPLALIARGAECEVPSLPYAAHRGHGDRIDQLRVVPHQDRVRYAGLLRAAVELLDCADRLDIGPYGYHIDPGAHLCAARILRRAAPLDQQLMPEVPGPHGSDTRNSSSSPSMKGNSSMWPRFRIATSSRFSYSDAARISIQPRMPDGTSPK